MSRLPDHLIDDVRSRTDIVDVVSGYVNLQRSGRRYKGLCPFHNEKTPSFHVDRENQFYYCFGCQAGGNVFNFLMEIEKLSFAEAVRRLAERAGIPVVDVESSPEEIRRHEEQALCYRVNEVARDFFVRCLFSNEGAEARKYLKGRGLTKETVQRFNIGFAPNDWHRLHNYLQAQGISEDAGIKAGVLARGKRGVYDWFRNRIMFPIADVQGRTVGFGGRIMSGDGAKYMNSPDTPIFTKGRHLYGIDVAASEFRPMERAVLVEGYMDVVGLYQGQYGPALASLGTAFTPEQARLLKRFTSEVVIAYDADGAGRTAALKGMEILAKEGLTVRVAQLPEGEDPDSFIKARGKDAFEHLVMSAKPLIEYQMEEALRGIDLSSVEGQIEGVRRVLPILKAIESPVGREGYIAHAAHRIGVTVRALNEELESADKYGRAIEKDRRDSRSFSRSRHNLSRSRYTNMDFVSAGPNSPRLRKRQPASYEDGLGSIEATLLTWVLKDPKSAKRVQSSLGESPFADARYNQILAWLLEYAEEMSGSGGVVSHINDLELAQVAGELLAREEEPMGPLEAYLKRAIEERERRHLLRLEAKLGSLMKSDVFTPDEVGRLVVLYKDVRDRLKFSIEHVHAS